MRHIPLSHKQTPFLRPFSLCKKCKEQFKVRETEQTHAEIASFSTSEHICLLSATLSFKVRPWVLTVFLGQAELAPLNSGQMQKGITQHPVTTVAFASLDQAMEYSASKIFRNQYTALYFSFSLYTLIELYFPWSQACRDTFLPRQEWQWKTEHCFPEHKDPFLFSLLLSSQTWWKKVF